MFYEIIVVLGKNFLELWSLKSPLFDSRAPENSFLGNSDCPEAVCSTNKEGKLYLYRSKLCKHAALMLAL